MTDPSSSSESLPPAGWYGDPANPTRQRWWNGVRWSDQVRGPQGDGPPTTSTVPPMPSSTQTTPVPPPTRPVTPAGPELAPYRVGPGSDPRRTGPTTADGVPVARFGRRVVATVIDNVIVAFFVNLVLRFTVTDFEARAMSALQEMASVITSGQSAPLSDSVTHLMAIVSYAGLGLTALYGLVTLPFWSRTVGQRLMRIAVCPTDKGTEKIGWRQAIPRTLAWTLLSQGTSFLVLIYLVSISMALWHPKRQTLPDLLAGTQVVQR